MDATGLNGGDIKLHDETIICAVRLILLQQSHEKWAQQGNYNGLQVSVNNSEGRRSLEKLECAKDNNIKMNLTELE